MSSRKGVEFTKASFLTGPMAGPRRAPKASDRIRRAALASMEILEKRQLLSTTPGVVAHYFNNPNWSGTPTVTTTVPNIDVDYGNGSPDPKIQVDNFSTQFTGKVHADTAGVYTFVSNSDDDGYLFIDGQLVSADPGGHGQRNADPANAGDVLIPVTLAANSDHNFVLEQHEGGGGAGVHMLWITPDNTTGTPVVVPADHLSNPLDPISTAPGSTSSAPTDLTVDATTNPNGVTLTWTDNAVNETSFLISRTGGGAGTVTFGGGHASGNSTDTPTNTVTFLDTNVVPGATYTYKVQAISDNGPPSAFSAPASGTTPAGPAATDNGVEVHYYNNPGWGTPTVTNFNPGRNDPHYIRTGTADETLTADTVDFNYASAAPDANITADFSAVYTGKVHTDAAGVYTFISNSDDDGFLWVNNTLVSADPGGHGQQDASTTRAGDVVTPITLAANTDYNFIFAFQDTGGGAGAHMEWIEPGAAAGTTPTIIPNDHLKALSDLPTAPTVSVAQATTTFTRLNWVDNSSSEIHYEVLRAPGAGASISAATPIATLPFDSTTYTDTTSAANTTYTYFVRGTNYDGVGAAGSATASTPLVDVPPDAAPTNLAGYGLSAAEGGNHLSFTDNTSNETGFIVERSTAAAGTFAPVTTLAGNVGTGAVAFTDNSAGLISGTTYYYRVEATNAGGTSAPTNVAPVVFGGQGGTGLREQIYQDPTYTTPGPVSPHFSGNAVLVKVDPLVDHDYGNGAPDPAVPTLVDKFSILWEGSVKAPVTGLYTFSTLSDDGSRLFIDTGSGLQLNVSNFFDQGTTERFGTPVQLTAGQSYPISMEYYENGGGAAARLHWTGPAIPDQAVPTSSLFPAASTPNLAPSNVSAASFCNDVTINWTDQSQNEGGFIVERSTNPTTGFVAIPNPDGSGGPTVSARDAGSFLDTGADLPAGSLASNTTYYYRVRAAGDTSLTPASAASAPSAVSTAVTGSGPAFALSSFPNSGMALNGNATVTNGMLQLTTATGNNTSSAFARVGENVGGGFNTSFDFKIPAIGAGNPPADGFTFVVANAGYNFLGDGGGALGYATGTANGQSAAIKFDLWPTNDPANTAGRNGTGLFVNQQAVSDVAAADPNNPQPGEGVPTGLDFASGDVFHVTLAYNATSHSLIETITDTTNATATPFSVTYSNVDLSGLIGGGATGDCAAVGFTGATGGASAEQDILNWTFTPTVPGSVPSPFPTATTAVVGRHLFYNNSAWDGASTAANAADNGAIATDKVALLPGQTATFANYSSYSKGINGIMIDVTGLSPTATLTAADFGIRVGNASDTTAWTAGPAPTVTILRGGGAAGSDRIELTWADFTSKLSPGQTPNNTNAIGGKWVQITMKADANTGLSTADTFYFGNAPGEEGDNPANAFVNATDEIGARNDPHQLFPVSSQATITNVHDYNRDKKVDATDQILARLNGTNFVNALKLINPAVGAPTSATSLAAVNAAASVGSGVVTGTNKKDGVFAASTLLE